MLRQRRGYATVCRPSVRLSVSDVRVCFSHRLEYLTVFHHTSLLPHLSPSSTLVLNHISSSCVRYTAQLFTARCYAERGYATVCRPLENFENNFTADKLKVSAGVDPNMGDLVQRKYPQN